MEIEAHSAAHADPLESRLPSSSISSDQRLGEKAQPHGGGLRIRVSRDVVERFLHHAVKVDGKLAVQLAALARPFLRDVDAGSFLETGEINLPWRSSRPASSSTTGCSACESERTFSSVVCTISRIFSSERCVRMCAVRALEHGSDGGEDLAEIVVEFAGDRAERAFLHGDQLLRQFAAPFRQRRNAGRTGGGLYCTR